MTPPPEAEARARPGPGARARTALAAKLVLGVALALGFLYFFLSGSDLGKLRQALAAADRGLVALAVAVSVAGLVLRAYRWRCYLLPIKPVAVRTSFVVMSIGYLVSNFLPGRVGDFVVRPLLMGRSERISKAGTLATIAVERLFDSMTVVVFFATYLAFFSPASLLSLDLTRARSLGWVMLAGCAAGIVLLVSFAHHEERYFALLGRLLGPLPARFRERLLLHARAFASGLHLFRNPANAAQSVVLSLAAWVTVGVAMWLAARSLDLGVRIQDSMLLMGLGALGVAIPAPGGVGSFHWLMFQGLLALGVPDGEGGKAAVILMWGMSFVPVTVIGILATFQQGIHWREIREATVEGEAP